MLFPQAPPPRMGQGLRDGRILVAPLLGSVGMIPWVLSGPIVLLPECVLFRLSER